MQGNYPQGGNYQQASYGAYGGAYPDGGYGNFVQGYATQQQEGNAKVDKEHKKSKGLRGDRGPPKDGSIHCNYKSKVCKRFEESGQCNFGDSCGFAHGESDLRKAGTYGQEYVCPPVSVPVRAQ